MITASSKSINGASIWDVRCGGDSCRSILFQISSSISGTSLIVMGKHHGSKHREVIPISILSGLIQ